jgi:hypothetical protein
MAGTMLQMLESQASSNSHFLWTGDESWMLSEGHYETMLTALGEEVNGYNWLTHCYRKTKVTASFNSAREYFLNFLPRSRSMNTNYFVEK